MLIPFPFAFLAGALLFDAAGRTLGRDEFEQTGRHLTAAGIGAGLLAAVPGIIDYFTVVPPRSSAARRATQHALSNVTGLALFALSWAVRRNRRATGASLTAEAVGLGFLSVGGWMGGTLVYRNQIGVDHRYANAGKWKELSIESSDAPLVAGGDDLEVNQMKLVHAGDARIAVARTEDGYAAFDDRCTHKGGPLSDGAVMCGTVQCPWHGSQFDVRTGHVTRGPAEEPIRTYALDASGDRVRLRHEPGVRPAVPPAQEPVHPTE